MSQILFFVNITVFDPREAFQFVNAGFYIATAPESDPAADMPAATSGVFAFLE